MNENKNELIGIMKLFGLCFDIKGIHFYFLFDQCTLYRFVAMKHALKYINYNAFGLAALHMWFRRDTRKRGLAYIYI